MTAKLYDLEPHLISKKDLLSLSHEDFYDFCQQRYSNEEFNIEENFGEKVRGSFGIIHVAGWTSNIKALQLLMNFGADINKKTNDENHLLDTFIESCFIQNDTNYYISHENVNNMYEVIKLLIKNSNYDFDAVGNNKMTPLHRFLRNVANNIKDFSSIPQTRFIIEDLISVTNIKTEDMNTYYHTDYVTLLAKTVHYFDKKMIDKIMMKNQITGNDMKLIPQFICSVESDRWKLVEDNFKYMVEKYHIPIIQDDKNNNLIQCAISYRNKGMFDIAVKAMKHDVDLIHILNESLYHCFKSGLYYVKRRKPQILIDYQDLINTAGNVPTKKLFEKLTIMVKYEMTYKNLNEKIDKNFENKKNKIKI